MTSTPPVPPTHLARGVLGSLPHFRRDPLDLLLRSRGDHGDVVRFRMFTRSLILVAHPLHVRRVLQEHATNYNKQTRGFQVLRTFLREGLLTSEGDHWLRQRRIAQPGFHHDRIVGFGTTMTRATEDLVRRWLRADTNTVDVTADMMRLTLRIVGETLLSADVSQESDRVGRALHVALRAANDAIGQVIAPPAWWPSRRHRALRDALQTLDAVILDIISSRRGTGRPADDLLSMLMQARDEDTGEGMSDAQLRDEAMTIFLAGHETTAVALGWTWHLLATHPDVRQRLEDEVDAAVGQRRPVVADLQHLSYVEQVVKESLRVYPPAWAISRCAIKDDVIGGFRVPAGSTVLISPYVTHRHPEFWPDPERFDPDRFDPARSVKRPPFAHFPFGGGPRQCIGNSFAMMELVLVVATIAQRCRLDTPPGGNIIGTQPSITLRPAEPIRMRVSPR